MKKSKVFLPVLLIVAFLLCFSFGVTAEINVDPGSDDANSYRITDALLDYEGTNDLWIGTLAQWKADGGKTYATNTFFDNGEAIHDNDIIITNGVVGAVLAVGTRNPWGYPAGSILDAGTAKVTGGKIEANRDTVWSIEYLVNGWDSWAPDNCGKVVFDLVNYDFANKKEDAAGLDAVKVTRKYTVAGHNFDITTYYSIAKGANYVYMFDQAANNGSATDRLSNRFSLTNKGDDGGAMQAINTKQTISSYGMKTADTAYSTWYTLPGTNVSNKGNSFAWNATGGSVGYKELRANYSFEAGEVVTYDEYIVLSNEPDTKALDEFLLDYRENNTKSINFTDVASDPGNSWYLPHLNKLVSMGAINGRTETTFVPHDNVQRGEFAKILASVGDFSGDEKVELSDVEGHWAESWINELISGGIINGYEDGTFRPDDPITRGELAKMVFYAFQVPQGKPTTPFNDVRLDWFYTIPINSLAAAGLVNGYEDGSFRPDNYVTRAETTKMVGINVEESYTIEGDISSTGGLDDKSAVIIKQNGKVYGWAMIEGGKYSFEVPGGDYSYSVFVESNGLAPGEEKAVPLNGGKVDLSTGKAKANLTINLKDKDGNPIWGKVELLNEYPTVRFVGNSVFQATTKGVINAKVNDISDFDATVFGQGYYFYSDTVSIDESKVSSNAVDVTIDLQFAAPTGWYSADPHHHANKNDAFADPADLVPSFLASDLDIGFASDHDFTVNNKETYDLIDNTYTDLIGFVPSEEISCSWAHFNVLPQNSDSYDYFLDANKENHVMNQFAKFSTFVQQTHDAGATITANHPWYSYGLFYAQSIDAVPGGYTDDYDTVEFNACCDDVESVNVMNDMSELWSGYLDGSKVKGAEVKKPHYIVGASDTHDVLYPGVTNDKGAAAIYASGKSRTYAYLGDTAGKSIKDVGLAYTKAVAEGNGYISYGPILDPGTQLFGGADFDSGAYQANGGKFTIDIDIQSLNGVQDVLVLSNLGQDSYTYKGTEYKEPKDFTIENVLTVKQYNGEKDTNFTYEADLGSADKAWFAVLVIDKSDYQMFALSNPYWVKK